jgi:hypothetical protein
MQRAMPQLLSQARRICIDTRCTALLLKQSVVPRKDRRRAAAVGSASSIALLLLQNCLYIIVAGPCASLNCCRYDQARACIACKYSRLYCAWHLFDQSRSGSGTWQLMRQQCCKSIPPSNVVSSKSTSHCDNQPKRERPCQGHRKYCGNLTSSRRFAKSPCPEQNLNSACHDKLR